ncbi:unnamed protein product, partial [Ectocarpus sp. 8 AP-2014]
QRVFIHYVLGKMLMLFFLCHPGTLATCDGQAYLRNRYANRDLVKTETELEDHRRHYKRRDVSEFAMRVGVPEEILQSKAGVDDNYTPDWAPTLEQRFHSTVKAWLRKGCSTADQDKPATTTGATHTNAGTITNTASTTTAIAGTTAAATADAAATMAAVRVATRGMAFVPTPHTRGRVTGVHRRASTSGALAARQRWVSPLAEVGSNPRRCSECSGCRRLRSARRGSAGNSQMLLSRFRSRGFPLRRGIFGGASEADGGGGASSSKDSNSGGGGEDYVEDEIRDQAAATTYNSAETLEGPERPLTGNGDSGGGGSRSSVLSTFLGGAADAYDSALDFVGCALVTSPLGKRYLSGASDGYNTVSTIRRTGGGPADMNSGSAYDLVGFSNIDPFEASGRGGGENRFLG